MNVLRCDEELCVCCGNCSKYLPGFREALNGRVYISDSRLKEEEISKSVELLTLGCPVGAITIESAVDSFI